MSYTYLEKEKHKGQKMVTIPYLMLVLTVSFVMVVSHTCIFSFSPSLKLLMRVASRPSLLLPSIPVKSYFRNFSPLFHLPLICLGGFCWNNTDLVNFQWFKLLLDFLVESSKSLCGRAGSDISLNLEDSLPHLYLLHLQISPDTHQFYIMGNHKTCFIHRLNIW